MNKKVSVRGIVKETINLKKTSTIEEEETFENEIMSRKTSYNKKIKSGWKYILKNSHKNKEL